MKLVKNGLRIDSVDYAKIARFIYVQYLLQSSLTYSDSMSIFLFLNRNLRVDYDVGRIGKIVIGGEEGHLFVMEQCLLR